MELKNRKKEKLTIRDFLIKVFTFLIILLSIFLFGFFLPATPRASQALLFGKIKKDSLLQSFSSSPRIILIGGSNLSFGINSKIIKDSLGHNPINTAIHANIGLINMMDNSLPHIQPGDIVIIAPEYQHFYGSYAFGREELLRTIFDVSPNQWDKLRKEQWLSVNRFIFKYALSKLDPREYFKGKENDIYGVNSFNQYGDVFKHWSLKKKDFLPTSISGELNSLVIDEICIFRRKVIEKKANCFITFPVLQSLSFEKNINKILEVERELKKRGLPLLGNPERYQLPDSLMFDTPYHPSKKGLDSRTQLLIADLKKELTFNTKPKFRK